MALIGDASLIDNKECFDLSLDVDSTAPELDISFDSIKTIYEIIKETEIKEDYYHLKTDVVDEICLKTICMLPNKISLQLCSREYKAEIDTSAIGATQELLLGTVSYFVTVAQSGEVEVKTRT